MQIEIRALRMDDAAALAALLNNEAVQDNLRDLPFPYTRADAEAYISAILAADRDTAYVWAITVDEVVAGCIGVFRKDNIHRLTAEMGYYIAAGCWGKGVMTDAVGQVCRYVFERTDIVRIFAEPFVRNVASCQVLEKAGFVYEGTLRKNAVKHGAFVDTKLYAIIKE